MIVHVVSTGDEVIAGDITDTNAAYLCRELRALGLDVEKVTAVGDDADIIASVLSDISRRVDLCLVTGGLGPTPDDRTAEACARAAGVDLELNAGALADIQAYFKKKGFQWTRDNEKQAMLPRGSSMMVNHCGTAPGFYMELNPCLFFFMPGVPNEMKHMFESGVLPILSDQGLKKGRTLVARLTTFGLPESRAGSLLKDFEQIFPDMRLGFRVDFPLIEIKIALTADLENLETSRQEVLRAVSWAAARLAPKVVSMQGRSLAEELGRLLISKGKTLALAESCTGGLMAAMMTDIPGSSGYFLFSGVTYANDAKIRFLDVNPQTLLDHGAVHERTALEMAEGARLKSGADFAISTTGIAGPGGGTADKPVGMVCIGLSGEHLSMARTFRFGFGDREMNRKMFAATALDLLRRHLAESGEAA